MTEKSEGGARPDRRVVINGCYGGFSLSRAAYLRLREMGHPLALAEDDPLSDGYVDRVIAEEKAWSEKHDRPFDIGRARKSAEISIDMQGMKNGVGSYLRDIPRDDPALVRVVAELGEKASGACAKLEIIDIPADAEWQIEEYDGSEHIAEKHRTWR